MYNVLGPLHIRASFPHNRAHEGDTIIIPILQVRTLRHSKDKTGHKGLEWKIGLWRHDGVPPPGTGSCKNPKNVVADGVGG